MTQGSRDETVARIHLARERNPHALGPILGTMMIATNLPPVAASNLLGVYDQTLYRWLYALGTISPKSLPKVAKLIMVLSWMVSKKIWLSGTTEERSQQFRTCIKQLQAAQKR